MVKAIRADPVETPQKVPSYLCLHWLFYLRKPRVNLPILFRLIIPCKQYNLRSASYPILVYTDSGLKNSTPPLVLTSASGCRASENFDISNENDFFPMYAKVFVMQGKCLFYYISRPVIAINSHG